MTAPYLGTLAVPERHATASPSNGDDMLTLMREVFAVVPGHLKARKGGEVSIDTLLYGPDAAANRRIGPALQSVCAAIGITLVRMRDYSGDHDPDTPLWVPAEAPPAQRPLGGLAQAVTEAYARMT